MKLLKPEEIKSAQESQNFKDVIRTQQIKENLKSANTELDDIEARFQTTLSKQRVIWAKEEEQRLKTLSELDDQIKAKTAERDNLLIPIEIERKKAHDLFQEAERTLESARIKETESEKIKVHCEDLQELLTSKIDSLTGREQDVSVREQKAVLERESLDHERESIKALSAEFTTKLNNVYGSTRLGVSA